jgi:hypothetical protein
METSILTSKKPYGTQKKMKPPFDDFALDFVSKLAGMIERLKNRLVYEQTREQPDLEAITCLEDTLNFLRLAEEVLNGKPLEQALMDSESRPRFEGLNKKEQQPIDPLQDLSARQEKCAVKKTKGKNISIETLPEQPLGKRGKRGRETNFSLTKLERETLKILLSLTGEEKFSGTLADLAFLLGYSVKRDKKQATGYAFRVRKKALAKLDRLLNNRALVSESDQILLEAIFKKYPDYNIEQLKEVINGQNMVTGAAKREYHRYSKHNHKPLPGEAAL